MSGETAEWVWRQRAAELEAERDAALRERDSLEHQRDVLIIYCDEEVERLIQVEARSVTRVWGKVRELEAERDAALARIAEAEAWFENHFVDEDGEPTGLSLAAMMEHVYRWGDGAWGAAGQQTSRRAELEEALAPLKRALELGDRDHWTEYMEGRDWDALALALGDQK